jgi:NDP-mannose synthase
MIGVILAGGLGTRLRPFTEVIPKPLLPIGGKSILQIQIERLRDNGFKEIYICTNYKSDYIEDFIGDGSRYGVSVIVSKENKRLGTAGPLTLLKKHLKDPFILMNGDIRIFVLLLRRK